MSSCLICTTDLNLSPSEMLFVLSLGAIIIALLVLWVVFQNTMDKYKDKQ